MAMEGRANLVAERLDRQAVDIQRQVLGVFTTDQQRQSLDRQPQQALMHDSDIVVAARARQQPRQRGLRRLILRQWHHPRARRFKPDARTGRGIVWWYRGDRSSPWPAAKPRCTADLPVNDEYAEGRAGRADVP